MAGPALVLYDGGCGLCTGVAGIVGRQDRRGALRLLPIGGADALRELERIGAALPQGWQANPDSMLVIADGRLLQRSDAVLAVAARLPAPWSWLRALRAVPRPVRDGAYRLLARSRRALSGGGTCARSPSPP